MKTVIYIGLVNFEFENRANAYVHNGFYPYINLQKAVWKYWAPHLATPFTPDEFKYRWIFTQITECHSWQFSYDCQKPATFLQRDSLATSQHFARAINTFQVTFFVFVSRVKIFSLHASVSKHYNNFRYSSIVWDFVMPYCFLCCN